MDFSGYSGGITFTITSTYGLLHLGVIEPGQKLMLFAGIAFTTVVLGGVVSDVNVHSSKPRQGLGKLLKVSAVALLVLWILHDLAVLRSLGFRLVETLGVGSIPVEYVGLAAMVVLGLVTAKLIGFGLDELFKHRSFSHSKAFLGLYGIVAFGLSYSAGILPTEEQQG